MNKIFFPPPTRGIFGTAGRCVTESEAGRKGMMMKKCNGGVMVVVVVILACGVVSGMAQTYTPTNEVSSVCQITDFEIPEDQTGTSDMWCWADERERESGRETRGKERERVW